MMIKHFTFRKLLPWEIREYQTLFKIQNEKRHEKFIGWRFKTAPYANHSKGRYFLLPSL